MGFIKKFVLSLEKQKNDVVIAFKKFMFQGHRRRVTIDNAVACRAVFCLTSGRQMTR